MPQLFDSHRHFALPDVQWSEADARAAIAEIADDALAAFNAETFWPSHPLDGAPHGLAGVYFGASGVIWALEYLKRAGAIDYACDFRPVLPKLIAHDDFGMAQSPLGHYGSLLMRDLGPLLLSMRLQPDRITADRIHARIAVNNGLPLAELMWGTAGSMLACLFAHSLEEDARFIDLYRQQASRMLGELEDAGTYRIWEQAIYGRRSRWLGLVHGFAGNMHASISGWKWLAPDQQRIVAEVSLQTLAATARRNEGGANWPSDLLPPDAPVLVQICHGAPGILTAFADAPFSSSEFERLLEQAGELVWTAGPLRKGSNFCHGTGGNAFALLKLYKRTGDPLWLDRARSFAAISIAQVREAQKEYGRGRYSLWTGDIGFAAILWGCIRAAPEFPALDLQ